MGKDWDKVVMGVEYWKECLRVLKAGSLIFVMSAPRQDVLSRAIINLQDAGFNTGFTSLYWAYASGFPKASNVSKMVDKRLGIESDTEEYEHPQRKNRSSNYSTGFSKAEERENKTGSKIQRNIATSSQAKALEGSYGGFQPKPSVEIVLVAMKPLSEKTYVDQAMKNGKGISWLDDCRIPYESEDDKNSMDIRHYQQEDCFQNKEPKKSKFQVKESNPQGRFPANLISSDNVLDDGRVSGGGDMKFGSNRKSQNQEQQMPSNQNIKNAMDNYGDTGSFNRYFDLDKWFTQRLKKLPESVQKVFPFLIVPKAGKSEKNKGCDELEEKQLHTRGCHKSSVVERPPEYKVQNNHPTSKPIKLMSYLITLGSREGDIVLDPFAGSGTTAIAAKMLKRKYIGIEKEKEYCKIAEERLKAFQEPML